MLAYLQFHNMTSAIAVILMYACMCRASELAKKIICMTAMSRSFFYIVWFVHFFLSILHNLVEAQISQMLRILDSFEKKIAQISFCLFSREDLPKRTQVGRSRTRNARKT